MSVSALLIQARCKAWVSELGWLTATFEHPQSSMAVPLIIFCSFARMQRVLWLGSCATPESSTSVQPQARNTGFCSTTLPSKGSTIQLIPASLAVLPSCSSAIDRLPRHHCQHRPPPLLGPFCSGEAKHTSSRHSSMLPPATLATPYFSNSGASLQRCCVCLTSHRASRQKALLQNRTFD